MQTQRFVAHFIFNRKKILCIHLKALDVDFQLLAKMLLHFLIWVFIGQKYFPTAKKCTNFNPHMKIR